MWAAPTLAPPLAYPMGTVSLGKQSDEILTWKRKACAQIVLPGGVGQLRGHLQHMRVFRLAQATEHARAVGRLETARRRLGGTTSPPCPLPGATRITRTAKLPHWWALIVPSPLVRLLGVCVWARTGAADAQDATHAHYAQDRTSLPMDRIEPTLPMDRIDPAPPMLRTLPKLKMLPTLAKLMILSKLLALNRAARVPACDDARFHLERPDLRMIASSRLPHVEAV
jgi:hypothetical protein